MFRLRQKALVLRPRTHLTTTLSSTYHPHPFSASRALATVAGMTAKSKHINIRTMTREDLYMVMGWAEKEGWDHNKYAVSPMYAADPSGYKLLEVNGKAVASLACIKYSQKLAFLGLYIVKPEERGKGYGRLLWDASLAALRGCQTMGLNAVMAQVNNYQKYDFAVTHENKRWRGDITHAASALKASTPVIQQAEVKKNFSINKVIDYDAGIFSTPRAAFLSRWLTMPESHTLAAMDGTAVRGYGVISRCQDGYKIAPLFADTMQIAENLYNALCHCVGNKGVVQIDVSGNDAFGEILAKRYNLKNTFTTVRMYKGPQPAAEYSKTFGLSTLEIG